jgi:hypothetical protein
MIDRTTNKIEFKKKKFRVQISNISTLLSYELDPSENMPLLVRQQASHNQIPWRLDIL